MHGKPSSDAATVERFYSAWNGGDLEGVIGTFAPEGEFRPVFGLLHRERRYQGRDGITAWFREFHDDWEEYRFDPEDMLAAGRHLVAIVRVAARRDLGEDTHARVAHVFALRDSLIVLLEARDADDTLDDLDAGDWQPP